MAIKLAVAVLIVCSVAGFSSGSSIPMWEFLSRDEKMSHLYSMLGKLVSDYCKANSGALKLTVSRCKHDLLGYGTNQLQRFSNNQLDNMDIFQRGAPELVWDTAMINHPAVKAVPLKFQPSIISSAPSPAVILGNPNHHNQKNPLFDDLDTKDSGYAAEVDAAHGYLHRPHKEPHNQLQEAASHHRPSTFLTGPHVVRVLPDGTPVEEDKNKPLPYDDDREVITVGRARYTKGHQKHYRSTKNYRSTQRH